jgi:hypothetical protein
MAVGAAGKTIYDVYHPGDGPMAQWEKKLGELIKIYDAVGVSEAASHERMRDSLAELSKELVPYHTEDHKKYRDGRVKPMNWREWKYDAEREDAAAGEEGGGSKAAPAQPAAAGN